MKIYRFPEYSFPSSINVYMMVIDGERVAYRFNQGDKFCLCRAVRGFYFQHYSYESGAIWIKKKSNDGGIYQWHVQNDDLSKVLELQKDMCDVRQMGEYLVFSDSDYPTERYIFQHKDTGISSEFSLTNGAVLDFDGSAVVYQRMREHDIVHQELGGSQIWSWSAEKIDEVKTWRAKRVALISVQKENGFQLVVLDLDEGKELLRTDLTGRFREVLFDGELAYVRTERKIVVYDHSEASIVHNLGFECDLGGVTISGNYIYVITQNPFHIMAYNKADFELLKTRELAGFHQEGVGIDGADSVQALRLNSDDPCEKRGFSWVGVFSDDEFFSDDWEVDIEPAYYHITEHDDLAGGVSLEITFEEGIDFDTLYRHANTGLQTAAYRHGFIPYPWAVDKPVNLNFNGKLVANFAGHIFSAEQKELIEELCQRCSNWIASLPLKAGDGETSCSLTSIIPSD